MMMKIFRTSPVFGLGSYGMSVFPPSLFGIVLITSANGAGWYKNGSIHHAEVPVKVGWQHRYLRAQ